METETLKALKGSIAKWGKSCPPNRKTAARWIALSASVSAYSSGERSSAMVAQLENALG